MRHLWQTEQNTYIHTSCPLVGLPWMPVGLLWSCCNCFSRNCYMHMRLCWISWVMAHPQPGSIFPSSFARSRAWLYRVPLWISVLMDKPCVWGERKWPFGNLLSAPKERAVGKALMMLLPHPKLDNRDCPPLRDTWLGGRRSGSSPCFDVSPLVPLGTTLTSESPDPPSPKWGSQTGWSPKFLWTLKTCDAVR